MKKINKNMKTKSNHWFILEEIPNAYAYLLSGPFKGFTGFFKAYMKRPMHINLVYKNNTLQLYFIKKEIQDNSKAIFNRIMRNPKFLLDLDKLNKKSQKEMFEYVDKFKNTNFRILSNKDLLKKYNEFTKKYCKTFYAAWIDNVLEYNKDIFSSYLMNYLSKKSKDMPNSKLFSLFSTPDKLTYGLKHEISLNNIIKEIKKSNKALKLFNKNADKICYEIEQNKIYHKINNMIEKHTKEYCWFFFMYQGPAWEKIDFISAIKDSIISNNNKNKDISADMLAIKRRKKKLIKELKIDKKHQILLKQASEMVYNKDYRKAGIYYALYHSVPMFREIAKRMNITLHQTRNITPDEMNKMFEKKTSLPDFNDREKGFLIELSNGKQILSSSKKAENFLLKLKNNKIDMNNAKELKGSCAFPGKIKGIARLVNLPSDMMKMNNKEILVSHQTNPDILPAMKKASAFVTDMGGITCHAAIVAREMRKPCIVGTKIATKVLKDGDIVEVDADNGIVKRVE